MTQNAKNKVWYKEPWPWILMVGPFIVIIAGVITAWLAVTSNDGLVSDDYYKQGMTVNQRLQRDHRAAELGVKADMMFSGTSVRLLLTAKDHNAYPDKIVIRMMHPTQAGMDQNVQMTSEGQGFYSGKMSTLPTGRWHVSIEEPSGQWRLQGDWLAESVEPLRLTARSEK